MEKYFKIGLPIIFFLIIAALAVIISLRGHKKSKIKKMYLDVEKTLKNIIVEEEKEKFNIKRVFDDAYDFLFETPKYSYYIKVIPNFKNREISINNAMKWQIRESIEDKRLRYVSGIESLMRLDIEAFNKEPKKLYIIYPNSRTLLQYINECEMVLIDSETDVYGTNIIPFVRLQENNDLIKI